MFYIRDLPRAERIVELRERRKAWIEVAAYTGFNSAAACGSWLLQFAKIHDRMDLLERTRGHYGKTG